MRQKLTKNNGYSLFEMVVVIIVLAVLVTVAFRYMQPNIDIAKTEETKQELKQIAYAIAGNPELVSGGSRTDFGYVGDNGSLPSSLADLVTNPGMGTWDGPYIEDDFYTASASIESEYLRDGWGKTYSYSGSVAITSTGSGGSITQEFASTSADLLTNNISFTIFDFQYCPPGIIYKDSISVSVTYPNGVGGMQTDVNNPAANGFVSFNGIPIGQHDIFVINLTSNDTIRSKVNINPKSNLHRDIQIPNVLWCDTSSGGGGSGVSGVETLRPNGSGSSSQLEDENCSTNWQCVDEVTADDNGTYVKGENNSWQYDLYNVENSSVGTGTIDSVVVFINVDGNHGNQKARTYIRTHGNNYQGSQLTPPSSYTIYSTTYATNPNTSSSWTWSEIDDLQIGAGLRREARLTQVWVEVYYTN
ncbi:MAG: prepilin-type N-terminal cleavage/methylation domain-containing protein [Calditrichaeota bacterium]|nr:MAG: prepilin-type N-terminal cleavage/methylation domain-containing protein [Calditrichota bacterium]